MALNLVITAIIDRNGRRMDEAAACLRRLGRLPDPNLPGHALPPGNAAHRPDQRAQPAFRGG